MFVGGVFREQELPLARERVTSFLVKRSNQETPFKSERAGLGERAHAELPQSCGLRVTSFLVKRSNQETPFKSEHCTVTPNDSGGYAASPPVFVVSAENLTRPTRGLAPANAKLSFCSLFVVRCSLFVARCVFSILFLPASPPWLCEVQGFKILVTSEAQS